MIALVATLLLTYATSSASAYYFTKGSPATLQVHFSTSSTSSDKNIAKYYNTAYVVAQKGQAWAKNNGVNLGSRTTSNIANEIRFHAIVYYYVPNIKFYSNGAWRYSKTAANPADVGNDDEYWGDYGPDVAKLARDYL